MKRKSIIAYATAMLTVIALLIWHFGYRVPLKALPDHFEGVYFIHLPMRERNYYYIHIENTPDYPQANVYVLGEQESIKKIGSYELQVYRIMRILKGNHGWYPSDEVLKIEFPIMDDALDLWIGEGRETYLAKMHEDRCIDGIYHHAVGAILMSSGQSTMDPSSKKRIVAPKTYNGIIKLDQKIKQSRSQTEL